MGFERMEIACAVIFTTLLVVPREISGFAVTSGYWRPSMIVRCSLVARGGSDDVYTPASAHY